MIQEEKDKLLKYLCMALPYGVMVLTDINKRFDGGVIDELKSYYNGYFYTKHSLTPFTIEEVKPYLRPMSSMTESERKILSSMSSHSINCLHRLLNYSPDWYYLIYNEVDWLLEHHFDFMGLIPMDCAIEITEYNNPYKE